MRVGSLDELTTLVASRPISFWASLDIKSWTEYFECKNCNSKFPCGGSCVAFDQTCWFDDYETSFNSAVNDLLKPRFFQLASSDDVFNWQIADTLRELLKDDGDDDSTEFEPNPEWYLSWNVLHSASRAQACDGSLGIFAGRLARMVKFQHAQECDLFAQDAPLPKDLWRIVWKFRGLFAHE
jgi:hypothetical protein